MIQSLFAASYFLNIARATPRCSDAAQPAAEINVNGQLAPTGLNSFEDPLDRILAEIALIVQLPPSLHGKAMRQSRWMPAFRMALPRARWRTFSDMCSAETWAQDALKGPQPRTPPARTPPVAAMPWGRRSSD